MQSAETFYETLKQPRDKKERKQCLKKGQVSGAFGDAPSKESEIGAHTTIYLRELNISMQYVPNIADFVVYLVKLQNCSRIFRLYQCRCEVAKPATLIACKQKDGNKDERKVPVQ